MSNGSWFRSAVSRCTDEATAIDELEQVLQVPQAKWTVLFVSPEYDLTKLAPLIHQKMGDRVTACTTAGEISPSGYEGKAIVGFSLYGADVQVEALVIDGLLDFEAYANQVLSASLVRVKETESALRHSRTFAVLLLDGVSMKEEIVTGIINNSLGNIPLVGGSSADNLRFGASPIYANGVFRSDRAALLYITTTVPFDVFKIQHFVPSETKIVITESDPEKRIVTEIDGEPAAECYARILGLDATDLSPMVFAEHPLMLKIGDDYYVRSVQKVNPDKSMSFYCAIDTGIVLTLAHHQDFLKTTTARLSEIAGHLGAVEFSIFFECILRKLEVERMAPASQERVFRLYESMNSVGFHTYGEQFGSLHINQTLTGVSFGRKKPTS